MASLEESEIHDGVMLAAERWKYFNRQMVFKEDVDLVERVIVFLHPIYEGLRGAFSTLKEAPDALLMVIVLKGIDQSGTHSRADIERAFGLSLPE